MNDVKTIYDAIIKRRGCSNGSSSDDSGSCGGLIVRGYVFNDAHNIFRFAPEKGEASFSDARDAYLSGTPVMYSITRQDQDADETEVSVFMSYQIDRTKEPTSEMFLGVYDGDNFVWELAWSGDGDEGESPK